MSDNCSFKKFIDLRYNIFKSLKQNSSKRDNSSYFKILNIETSDYQKKICLILARISCLFLILPVLFFAEW